MSQRSRNSGFSLLEVLLSLAVGGMLLTGATAYTISISNIWINEDDGQFFQQHVDGVEFFLNNALAHSEAIEKEEGAIAWSRPPGFSEFDDPLLAFQLKEAPAILSYGEAPLPAVTCYLYLKEREGLALLWYPKLKRIEGVEDIYNTALSTFVKSAEYCYYDKESDQWKVSAFPEEDARGLLILPDLIKLRFEHEGEDPREVPVYLSLKGHDVPLF
jgi:prepilin-type N-terminal cleavage/methylation domain-containing protein